MDRNLVQLKAPQQWVEFAISATSAALASGHDVVLVTSEVGPRVILDALDTIDDRLTIIDWNTHQHERVIGVEVDGPVLRCARDLINVRMAMNKAIKDWDKKEKKVIIVDIIPAASRTFGDGGHLNALVRQMNTRASSVDARIIWTGGDEIGSYTDQLKGLVGGPAIGAGSIIASLSKGDGVPQTLSLDILEDTEKEDAAPKPIGLDLCLECGTLMPDGSTMCPDCGSEKDAADDDNDTVEDDNDTVENEKDMAKEPSIFDTLNDGIDDGTAPVTKKKLPSKKRRKIPKQFISPTEQMLQQMATSQIEDVPKEISQIQRPPPLQAPPEEPSFEPAASEERSTLKPPTPEQEEKLLAFAAMDFSGPSIVKTLVNMAQTMVNLESWDEAIAFYEDAQRNMLYPDGVEPVSVPEKQLKTTRSSSSTLDRRDEGFVNGMGTRGLTNGLGKGRGTKGMTNGLGRVNGLTNGMGRVNGLTNGLGRVNGLTNGLTNGIGRVNGLTNGLTNGLGRVNGLTNGLTNGLGRKGKKEGFVNGSGLGYDIGIDKEMGLVNGNGLLDWSGHINIDKRKIPGLHRNREMAAVVLLLMMILSTIVLFPFISNLGPSETIMIDGAFEDWAIIDGFDDSAYDQIVDRSLNIIQYKTYHQGDKQSFYLQTEAPMFFGAGDSIEVVHLFLDTDLLAETGYSVGSIGADLRIEVKGSDGDIIDASLFKFNESKGPLDWNGFIFTKKIATANDGREMEFQMDRSALNEMIIGDSNIRFLTMNSQGEMDMGDDIFSTSIGTIRVVQRISGAPIIYSLKDRTPVLTLEVACFGRDHILEEMNLDLLGDTTKEDIDSFIIFEDTDGSGNLTPTDQMMSETDHINERSTRFTFSPSLVLTDGQIRTFFVAVDLAFNAQGGRSLGVIIPTSGGLGLQVGPVTITSINKGLSYVDHRPQSVVIDGAFADWDYIDVQYDQKGDMGSGASDIDMMRYGTHLDDGNLSFFVSVDDTILGGTSIPQSYGSAAPVLSDTDSDGIPDINDAFPNDFDDDTVPDGVDTDRDQDGILDFPNGDDLWLNRSITGVSIYIGPPPPPDSDHDGISDPDDIYPNDFDNDGVDNENDLDDDGDRIPDYPGGEDVWLENPITGAVLYIGPPIPGPYVSNTGEDTMMIYIDSDNDVSTGFLSSAIVIGADHLIWLSGKDGVVNSSTVFEFNSSDHGASAWNEVGQNVSVGMDMNRMELGVNTSVVPVLDHYRYQVVLQDWRTGQDVTDNVGIRSSDTSTRGPQPPYWVYGTIYDESGSPAVGAFVNITNNATGNYSIVLTDANGQYIFDLGNIGYSNGDNITIIGNTTTQIGYNYTTVNTSSGGSAENVPMNRLPPSMDINKNVNSTIVNAGSSLTYDVWFNNTGAQNATTVWVNDTLPRWISYVSSWSSTQYNMTMSGSNLSYVFDNVTIGPHWLVVNVSVSSIAQTSVATNFIFCRFTDEAGTSNYSGGQDAASTTIIGGSQPPHWLFGWVNTTSGTPITGANVTLTNEATGENVTVQTNANGQYLFDAATWPSGYSDGDSVNGTVNVSVSGVFKYDFNGTSINISAGGSRMNYVIASPPNISVQKTVNSTLVYAGGSAHYVVWFNNTGGETASVVWINDTLPRWMSHAGEFSTDNYNVTINGRNLTFVFDNVTVGTHSLQINVSIAVISQTTVATNFVFCNHSDAAQAANYFGGQDAVSTTIIGGTQPPYWVYGWVNSSAGVPMPNVNVTLVNQDSGDNVTLVTNANGQYIYDLATLPNGYSQGDVINGTANTIIEDEVTVQYNSTTVNTSTGGRILNFQFEIPIKIFVNKTFLNSTDFSTFNGTPYIDGNFYIIVEDGYIVYALIWFNNSGSYNASDVWINDTAFAGLTYISDNSTNLSSYMDIAGNSTWPAFHFRNVTPNASGWWFWVRFRVDVDNATQWTIPNIIVSNWTGRNVSRPQPNSTAYVVLIPEFSEMLVPVSAMLIAFVVVGRRRRRERK